MKRSALILLLSAAIASCSKQDHMPGYEKYRPVVTSYMGEEHYMKLQTVNGKERILGDSVSYGTVKVSEVKIDNTISFNHNTFAQTFQRNSDAVYKYSSTGQSQSYIFSGDSLHISRRKTTYSIDDKNYNTDKYAFQGYKQPKAK